MAEKDPQLETRKRARRRLVGAAALALVAAVVLPMVMDAEPRPLTEDIQIRIPNPDATAALSRPLPMKDAPKAEEPAKAAAEPAVPVEADGGSVKASAEPAAKTPKNDPAKSALKPAAAVEVRADKVAKAEPTPNPQSEAKPVVLEKPDKVEKAEKADKADKAESTDKPEKSAPAKSIEPKSAEQFVVQLGVFSDSDNARRVRTKAKGLGFDSFSEPLKTADGEKIRVRAGPFASRAAAEAARAKLSEAGLAGVVTVKQ